MAEGKEAKNNLDVAEAAYRRAVRLYDLSPESEPAELAEALLSLARVLNVRCRNDDALKALSRGESVLDPVKHSSPLLLARFSFRRAWIAAFVGNFVSARAEAEVTLERTRRLPKELQPELLSELGAFIADIEEERGRFNEAAAWLERIRKHVSENEMPSDKRMAFFHPDGVALRLHHSYRIAGANEEADALAKQWKIISVRVGERWPSSNAWVVPAGACGGLPNGSSPYDALDDTPELDREMSNCFGRVESPAARLSINVLFSADGRVLSAQCSGIDLDREQIDCACRTVRQAKLPPIDRGYRSRRLEATGSGAQPDYRGL
jgi:tetratricopeptide (TPR) repeat protein